ncbi:MAG: hypothetical protein H0X25_00215 [Acidobacteriales bacterium]|nr:hypothetical protein [Terriglobales bacterium]
MTIDEVEVVELELKYCERCAGIWVRPVGSDASYCLRCETQMNPIPIQWRGRGSGPHLMTRVEVEGKLQDHVMLCEEGGNA